MTISIRQQYQRMSQKALISWSPPRNRASPQIHVLWPNLPVFIVSYANTQNQKGVLPACVCRCHTTNPVCPPLQHIKWHNYRAEMGCEKSLCAQLKHIYICVLSPFGKQSINMLMCVYPIHHWGHGKTLRVGLGEALQLFGAEEKGGISREKREGGGRGLYTLLSIALSHVPPVSWGLIILRGFNE